jgi:hypothetical protein
MNWRKVFGELIIHFHWTPDTVDNLTLQDLMWWHESVVIAIKK